MISQCLHKYKCRYILYLPGYRADNEGSLNFGSFIHKVFELGAHLHHMKELSVIAESERKTYKISFDMNASITKCLENFLIFNRNLGETISLECPFEVPLSDEKDQMSHRGVIDRLVKGREGGVLVIDYKTGKREKSKAELMKDGQMLGYAYAIHILYDIPYSEIYCAHYYPMTNNLVSVRFSKFQVENWKRGEIEKIWRIRKKTADDFPPMRNVFCKTCEFIPVCNAFTPADEVEKNMAEQLQLAEAKKEEGEKKRKEFKASLLKPVKLNTSVNPSPDKEEEKKGK